MVLDALTDCPCCVVSTLVEFKCGHVTTLHNNAESVKVGLEIAADVALSDCPECDPRGW